MSRYFIKTYGCQMNLSDSERIDTILHKAEYLKATNPKNAETLIINTCSVRQKAEDRVIGWTKVNMSDNTQTVIITGCMARRDFDSTHHDDTQKFLKLISRKFKFPVIFVDIRDIANIPKIINQRVGESQKDKATYPITHNLLNINNTDITCENLDHSYLSIAPSLTSTDITANIPIMTGCQQFCAYCIVPFSRGEEYYRPADDILNDVKTAISHGKTHITLLGQIVNKWQDDNLTFTDFLKEICAIDSDFWLTFSSPHPKYFDDNLIKFIANEPKMMKYLGLPLQSASDRILKLMNRGYTYKEYSEIITSFKAAMKNVPYFITTDIIVGFPTETDDDFEESVCAVHEHQFNNVFLSQYSPRPQTTAFKTMPDDILYAVKKSRWENLSATCKDIFEKRNQLLLGLEIPCRPQNSKSGQTYFNQYIELDKVRPSDIGKVCKAKIVSASRLGLRGTIV